MNLQPVIKQLQEERDRACKNLERLETALASLEMDGARKIRKAAKSGHKMSTAARRRIAQAQKARWRAWRKAKKAIA